jgi:hypothetical protein
MEALFDFGAKAHLLGVVKAEAGVALPDGLVFEDPTSFPNSLTLLHHRRPPPIHETLVLLIIPFLLALQPLNPFFIRINLVPHVLDIVAPNVPHIRQNVRGCHHPLLVLPVIG